MNYAVRILLSLLAVWGLISIWRKRKSEPNTMLLFAFAGIFLSIPFVPPNDSNQMRVYAATITFLIYFTTIGLHSLISLITKRTSTEIQNSSSNAKPALWFGSILAAFAIVGVLLVNGLSQPTPQQVIDCPQGLTQFFTRLNSGTMVKIAKVPQDMLQHQLNVEASDFSSTFEGFTEMHTQLVNAVENSQTGVLLARPLDLLTLQFPLLIIPSELLPTSTGMVNICARPAQDSELAMRGYWYVESISYSSATE